MFSSKFKLYLAVVVLLLVVQLVAKLAEAPKANHESTMFNAPTQASLVPISPPFTQTQADDASADASTTRSIARTKLRGYFVEFTKTPTLYREQVKLNHPADMKFTPTFTGFIGEYTLPGDNPQFKMRIEVDRYGMQPHASYDKISAAIPLTINPESNSIQFIYTKRKNYKGAIMLTYVSKKGSSYTRATITRWFVQDDQFYFIRASIPFAAVDDHLNSLLDYVDSFDIR